MATKYASLHTVMGGPGDQRPTALQVLHDEGLANTLSDKVIFLTGCSSGIGITTSEALFTTGATLYLTARDISKAKQALRPDLLTSSRVHLLELDLNCLSSVRKCADEFQSHSQQLNIFIANAGVMATPETKTIDGFESQLGTNHLAHFLLFNLLTPALLDSATPSFNSRAIILTSVYHRLGSINWDNMNLTDYYDPQKAYAQSKLANAWTANEIDRRHKTQGLRAFSVHPGGVMTGITKYITEEDEAALKSNEEFMNMLKSPEQGAATTVWAAVAKCLEGKGGMYLEDCGVSDKWKEDEGYFGTGYGENTYDNKGEERLWKVSLKLVGLEDDL